ncbi:hypothetical protein B0H17DRAFT_1156753 [Mycena rosella]|uniref:UBX domain-containing protein n=1 Tax=Mycena rosella TaxID=1033263 RepID=A0AAD7GTX2_MYCRO|nr:hypothetical protein B0H17DRAFT_1156753 [Mycena rosella]
MTTLSPTQQAALGQLRDLTNGGDDDVAVSMLESVDWDVQRAAELIFGSVAPPAASDSSSAAPRIASFEIDDSEQHQPVVPRNNPDWSFSFLAFPFQLLSSLFRFLFGFLRIPLPRPFAFNLAFFRPRRTPPRGDGGADRWVRELEEETGALCMSASSASGVDAAGPSTLTHRGATTDRKVLPDFMLGTYEEALRVCQRDFRIGCIVLVSEEHDDVPEFKRTTLTDPALVRLLHANDIVVWGGDVRDREAYSASLKLQATTYPFVAFLALQPRRTPRPTSASSSNSTPPTLTVLSRHQGPPGSATSPATLAAHLESQLLPRVTPFLARLRAAQHTAAADRALRSEQDRAFRETAARDGARIEALMQADARAAREAEAARVAQEAEAARLAHEAAERQKRATQRAGWRRWTRRALAAEPEDAQGVRLAIRLPDGARVVRRFADTRTLTALYTFVDAQLADADAAEDPEESPAGHRAADVERAMEEQIDEAGAADAWWGFQLVLAYPRREIPWARGTVGGIECLKGGAQLVVHMLATATHETAADGESDDDGYVSEE